MNFYDANNGVFLGDQKNGKWGIGLSTNGGSSWTQPSVMPAPQTDENGLAGCATFVGDAVWFGTNQGRVIKSNDRGSTWQATEISGAGQVYAVATLDGSNGFAVYNESGSTDKIVASTTNGGSTWVKNRYNFTTTSCRSHKRIRYAWDYHCSCYF